MHKSADYYIVYSYYIPLPWGVQIKLFLKFSFKRGFRVYLQADGLFCKKSMKLRIKTEMLYVGFLLEKRPVLLNSLPDGWFLLNFGHKKTGTYNIPVYRPVLVEWG